MSSKKMPRSAFAEKQNSPEEQLADFVGGFYADLYGFLVACYPWKEPGTILELFEGPENWVQSVADDISNAVAKNGFNGKDPVTPTSVALASGNGCAKSTLSAMVVDWIMSTRPYCQGTVTANTGSQLRTKTWQEIEKWTSMCVTSDWFDLTAEHMRHKIHGSKWATNAVTWNLRNTQAFAGQHARQSSSFYIWDESSHIPDPIFDQADGGLVDGEPFSLLLGNPGNRVGKLYRAVYGDLKHKYISRSIDSRTCRYTNKAQINEWIAERGENSDWVRVHVYGLPPAADDLQFIDTIRVAEARKRRVPVIPQNEPLIMGIDFARGGSNWNRISYRRGRDGRAHPSLKIPGDQTRDTMRMVSLVLEEIRDKKPAAIFGDATGIGGPIMDQIRALSKACPIIDFISAGKSPDKRYANASAYVYSKMKEWLVDACIEDDEELEMQLTNREYYHIKDRLMLETKEQMQERGVDSPDWADSLAMTFWMPVLPEIKKTNGPSRPSGQTFSGKGWMRG